MAEGNLIAILGLTAIAAVGIVAVVAIVFGRGFRGEIYRNRLTIETQAEIPFGLRRRRDRRSKR